MKGEIRVFVPEVEELVFDALSFSEWTSNEDNDLGIGSQMLAIILGWADPVEL